MGNTTYVQQIGNHMLQWTHALSPSPASFHWRFLAKMLWSHNLFCLHWGFCEDKSYFQIPSSIAHSVFLQGFRQLFLLGNFTSESMSKGFLGSWWESDISPTELFLPSVYWENKLKSRLSKTSFTKAFQIWFVPKSFLSPLHIISPLELPLKL